ncbi:hypothetical protein PGT21_006133 [Puccinia graminis f. sp. tritici]|uniref:Uncharacterized protein n=1 Tax=Puccinia graminis f. sp. tritici TaxID=56615 RepID=A0A5B0QMJ7_PUCGR|nr:hypothetical protein PGT21_006133 [Puccinia graminis f. sp. tritici]
MIPVDPASQRPRGYSYTILSYSPFLEKTNCLTCKPPSIIRIQSQCIIIGYSLA